MYMSKPTVQAQRWGQPAFTLSELLVVVGVIALLLAIIISPLNLARRQAMSARCAGQQKDIGVALEGVRNDYGYYPLWDDGGSPNRYTFMDVLLELRAVTNVSAGYCPEDPRPSPLNSERGRYYQVLYPGLGNKFGIDYSYGIGVPLSAGGQSWNPSLAEDGDTRPRRFSLYQRNSAQRLLMADGEWSHIYNLNGDPADVHNWSYPTQYDNTIAWRHANYTANVLYQDGHVARIQYQMEVDDPINTTQTCVWYPGEPLAVNHESEHDGEFYPDAPPIDLQSGKGVIPGEVVPRYYTNNLLWTQITHK